jgi:ketosteroid isomerase-like protein
MITPPIGIGQIMSTEHIQARLAITELVARFDDSVNRRDVAQFEQLWANDAVWEIGEPLPMRVAGGANIIETWQKMLAGTQWLFRGSFAGVINVQADTATGRWPCIETGSFADGTGYDNRAIYQDQYIQRDGRWLFQSRRYHYLWLSRDPLAGQPVALSPRLALPG